jgi:hypothetical protein
LESNAPQELRLAAIEMVRRSRSRSPLPALKRIVASDPHEPLQISALHCIAQIDPEGSPEILRECISGESRPLARAAFEMLGKEPSPQSLSSVLAAEVEVSDYESVYLLSFLFNEGSAPPAPGHLSCGHDATPDALECALYAGPDCAPSRMSLLEGPPPPQVMAEYQLNTGRMTKIPVSWCGRYQVTISGAHQALFRAVCLDAETDAGACDTGLLVTYGSRTLYNNNAADPVGRGTGKAGSLINVPSQSASMVYTVLVFSQVRATSRTTVDYSLNNGATWARLSGTLPIETRGTLVSVGPLQNGDGLEVQSRGALALDDDTHMVLFSPDNSSLKPAITSLDASGTDFDPRIAITTTNWASPNNYVLLSKSQRHPFTPSGVETRVDLLHLPLSQAYSVSRTACGGSCSAALQPGRYLVYVFATIDRPVGWYGPDPSTQHLSGNMPVLDADGCPNDGRDHYGDATWYRGQPNDFALTMRVERQVTKGWMLEQSRRIPRGAFGAGPGHGWNKFAMEVQVDLPATYRVVATALVPGVTLFGEWRYERNPEATELKAVSYNTLYNSLDVFTDYYDNNKYKNVANLLGTRGSIFPLAFRVEERPDQAPFQWEADVLALQEVMKGPDDNSPGDEYDDPVLSYAIMSDSNYESPMNPEGRGVEMYRDDNCDRPGSVANDSRGYAPNHSLGCDSWVNGGVKAGAPALHSDHRPMGVRLRVWSR